MNNLQRFTLLSLMSMLSASNDYYSLSDPKLNDTNVNYKGNRTGEIKAGKNRKRGRRLSKKQRKVRK